MTPRILKRAWVRDANIPVGISAKGKFTCPCNNAPLVDLKEGGQDIICTCGRRYAWDGAIKGRSQYCEPLTSYQVVFADGSSYVTAMSAITTLQIAYRYFIDRVIEGKMVVDVRAGYINGEGKVEYE